MLIGVSACVKNPAFGFNWLIDQSIRITVRGGEPDVTCQTSWPESTDKHVWQAKAAVQSLPQRNGKCPADEKLGQTKLSCCMRILLITCSMKEIDCLWTLPLLAYSSACAALLLLPWSSPVFFFFSACRACRWLVAQKDPVKNGEMYRMIADTGGAFVQPALYEAFGLTVVEVGSITR